LEFGYQESSGIKKSEEVVCLLPGFSLFICQFRAMAIRKRFFDQIQFPDDAAGCQGAQRQKTLILSGAIKKV